MKKLMSTSLAMMAISTSGCTTSSAQTTAYRGRMIEFKSGPEGFDTKTFFYEGQNEVIAFDAQFTPALAEQALLRLREFTDKPVTWLVITHPNPDKFNGIPVFQKAGARVIASKATALAMPEVHAYKKYYFEDMAKMFKKGEYPALPSVDQTFEGQQDLILRGGERISLKELDQPGVSTTQTIASISSVSAVVVGDLVHYKAHAWLEGGIVNGKPTPTLSGWKADLEQIKSLFPAESLIYGGRGEVGSLDQVINAQINYLDRADQIVGKYIGQLGNRASELSTDKAQSHYVELQHLFEKAFPDYSLGYMIQYGIYGLVNSKL